MLTFALSLLHRSQLEAIHIPFAYVAGLMAKTVMLWLIS
jgi:hypothetical protein